MADRAAQVARSDINPPVKAPRLTLGARRDEAELDADRAARAAVSEGSRGTSIASRGASGASSSPTAPEAPPSVHAALKTPAQPLEGTTRSFMERKFGHRFSDVRVHDGPEASSSAHDIRASAYTVGKDIVFAGGRYAPSTGPGQQLLAHELAHVVQNSGMAQPSVVRRQSASAPTASAPAAPRPDYVFIMGADVAGSANKFYTSAQRFYRSHLPKATVVLTVKNLADLLTYISTNVTGPVGNVYIVTHANEDGTVSFGLNAEDKDKTLGVLELRTALHPVSGTATGMAKVTAQIDKNTRIHIKGCDLGRTQEIVELLDEAFGGEGTVTAPTHEQVFGNDPALEDAERARFRAAITAQHPMPAPVDSSLTGKEKAQKTKERQAEVKQRDADLKADLAAHKPEENRLAEEAGTYESYSGPMFQHPGPKLFTKEDLAPKVTDLYPHLSEPQQATLVKGLVANDPRPAAVANKEGVHGQHGQRAYQRTLGGFKLNEPDTAAQASRLFAQELANAHFRATGTPSITKTNVTGGFTVSYLIPGELSLPKKPTQKATLPLSYPKLVVPSDATLLANGRKDLPNPDKYDISLKSEHATTGVTTRTVVAQRVVAYLHHGELDASAHQHFDRPESDKRFFATSTFSPKPPPPAGGAGASSGPKGPKP